jgi:hypothetical protein
MAEKVSLKQTGDTARLQTQQPYDGKKSTSRMHKNKQS